MPGALANDKGVSVPRVSDVGNPGDRSPGHVVGGGASDRLGSGKSAGSLREETFRAKFGTLSLPQSWCSFG